MNMQDVPIEQCWGSHLPSLFAALMATSGAVLEVGAGLWSTPLLRTFCQTARREFVTLEENAEWAERCGSCFVHLDFMGDVLKTIAQGPWSVVFLDHNGHKRAEAAEIFARTAPYIVVHDWGAADIMKPFEPILHLWKHQFVDKRFSPATLTLTNSDELADRVWMEKT
jgi:hypothetical protein